MKNGENKKTLEEIEDVLEEDPKVAASNKKSIIAVAIFALLILGSYAYPNLKDKFQGKQAEIKGNTEKFIRENLVQPGTDLKISEFQKEGDLYKMSISVGGQDITAYVTKDGSKLFPQVIDMNKSDESKSSAAPKVAEASEKKDKPDVELFVMSYCPYGIQAEKGILPAVQKLGAKINFSVKFVDYTLHGKKEFDENLNQYCIQKEEPDKFSDYLACFAKEGDADKCISGSKINNSKIKSCIAVTDKQFKLSENFKDSAQTSPFNIYKDLNDKYGVQGSPSLVVNGQLLETGRDSASLMKTICSGFTNKPEECDATLSSESPAPGFGEGKTTASASGSANTPSCH